MFLKVKTKGDCAEDLTFESRFYYQRNKKKILIKNPESLIGKRMMAIAAIKIESVFSGTVHTLTTKLEAALVIEKFKQERYLADLDYELENDDDSEKNESRLVTSNRTTTRLR